MNNEKQQEQYQISKKDDINAPKEAERIIFLLLTMETVML
jgi:hypothetical protein